MSFHFLYNDVYPTFNSATVKPRPARTRRLYLIVGARTIGLSLSTGRGAIFAAFWRRAVRRLSFPPACRLLMSNWQSFAAAAYLVEVNSDATLPILAEI